MNSDQFKVGELIHYYNADSKGGKSECIFVITKIIDDQHTIAVVFGKGILAYNTEFDNNRRWLNDRYRVYTIKDNK